MRCCLLSLILLGVAQAQLADIYKLLSEDDDDTVFADSTGHKVFKTIDGVHRAVGRMEDAQPQEVIGQFGDLFGKTENLFGKVFGALLGRISGKYDDEKSRSRPGPLDPKSDEEDSAESNGPSSVFSLIDSLGSIPMKISTLEGEHICVREISKTLKPTNGTLRSATSCQSYRNAYKCVHHKETPKGGRETTRIQECCDGYDSEDIQRKGCSQEFDVQSLRDTLFSMNNSASELLNEDSAHFSENGRFTFIVPSENAHVNHQKNPNVRSAIEKLIFPEAQRDYDWSGVSEIKNAEDGIFRITQNADRREHTRTTINCVPLERTNIRVSNGILHISEDLIQPIEKSILHYLDDQGNFKIFISLLDEELIQKLQNVTNGNGFTVFPFTDDAFSQLSDSIKEQIVKKSGCTKDLIRNHIFPSTSCISSVVGNTLKSLSGYEIRVQEMITKEGSSLRIGTSKILKKNILTGSGIVHIVDEILASDELLTWKDQLEKFNEPLMRALKDVPMSEEPVTVFVPPTNLTEKVADISSFAKNHIVVNRILNFTQSTTLTTLGNSTMWAGRYTHSSPILIRVSMGHHEAKNVQIGCNKIMGTSVKSCNSVIYFLEKPLPTVTQSLEQFFGSRNDLSKFYSLLKKSKVEEMVKTTSPLTIFAPSDDAFSNNDLKKLNGNETLRNMFVKRYIFLEPLCAIDLLHHPSLIKVEMYQNLLGEGLMTNGIKENLHIEGARIQEADIVLTNGVVHILENMIQKNFESARSPAGGMRLATNILNLFGN